MAVNPKPANDVKAPLLDVAIARALTGQPTDFAAFTPAAIRQALVKHKVYALLNQARLAGSATGFDRDSTQLLENNAKGFAMLDLAFTRETQQLLHLLGEQGISALLIKGFPIAHRYYPASYLRHRVDVDVLLSEADWSRSMPALEQAGYQLDWAHTNTVTSKQFTATVPRDAPQAIVFDIHKRISNRSVFMNLLPFDVCLERRIALTGVHKLAFTLATSHQLILSCLHRLAHGRNAERDRLTWLYDVRLMLQSMTRAEQEYFVEEALSMQMGTVCADAVMQSEIFFGNVLDADLVTQLSGQAMNEPASRLLHAGKLRWLLADFNGQPDMGQKLSFIRETLINQLRLN